MPMIKFNIEELKNTHVYPMTHVLYIESEFTLVVM